MKGVLTFIVLIHFSYGDWLRIGGSDVGNQPSNIADNLTYPGSRAFQASWSDNSGNLWMFGGYGFAEEMSDQPHTLNDLWLFNGTSETWSIINEGTSMQSINLENGKSTVARVVPKPRLGSVSCGVPDIVLVVFGGEDSWGSPLYDTWLYDLEDRKSWIPLSIKTPKNVIHPPARSHASFWCLKDRVLIYGGTGAGGKLLNDLWQFSLKELKWELKKSFVHDSGGNTKSEMIPEPRAGAATWAADDLLYMFGGSQVPVSNDLTNQESNKLFSDMWLLDEQTLTWKALDKSNHKIKTKPTSRVCSNVWVKNNDLLLFGGYGMSLNRSESTFLNDLWVFDKITSKWHRIPLGNSGKFRTKQSETGVRYAVPDGRCCGAVFKHDRTLYFFGGRGIDKRGNNVLLNDLFLSSNHTQDLTPYLSLAETHTQQMLRELSPKMIFVICLSSFSSVGLVFCAILFVKKMVEYHPRHKPVKSKYNAKYAPVELIDTDHGSDLEIEM